MGFQGFIKVKGVLKTKGALGNVQNCVTQRMSLSHEQRGKVKKVKSFQEEGGGGN